MVVTAGSRRHVKKKTPSTLYQAGKPDRTERGLMWKTETETGSPATKRIGSLAGLGTPISHSPRPNGRREAVNHFQDASGEAKSKKVPLQENQVRRRRDDVQQSLGTHSGRHAIHQLVAVL